MELMPEVGGFNIRRHLYFAAAVAASILLYWKTLSTLATFSLHEEIFFTSSAHPHRKHLSSLF